MRSRYSFGTPFHYRALKIGLEKGIKKSWRRRIVGWGRPIDQSSLYDRASSSSLIVLKRDLFEATPSPSWLNLFPEILFHPQKNFWAFVFLDKQQQRQRRNTLIKSRFKVIVQRRIARIEQWATKVSIISANCLAFLLQPFLLLLSNLDWMKKLAWFTVTISISGDKVMCSVTQGNYCAEMMRCTALKAGWQWAWYVQYANKYHASAAGQTLGRANEEEMSLFKCW